MNSVLGSILLGASIGFPSGLLCYYIANCGYLKAAIALFVMQSLWGGILVYAVYNL